MYNFVHEMFLAVVKSSVSLQEHKCLNVFVCVNLYIYIYIYIHTHTYIHTYIHISPPLAGNCN